MSLPTANQVINLYLFGEEISPNSLLNEAVIRSSSVEQISTAISKQEYMSVGAGRFAVGAQFDIISLFFNADITTLPSKPEGEWYSKDELASIFGLSYYGEEVCKIRTVG